MEKGQRSGAGRGKATRLPLRLWYVRAEEVGQDTTPNLGCVESKIVVAGWLMMKLLLMQGVAGLSGS